ncbi:MAG TPA: XrtA system polysaccharide chain length determinant [Stellaceae bacterium]|nr:XrtA system polysaccharide chain length determinant [Stellaceae bacterium]
MNSKIVFFYLQGIWRRKWMTVAICWAVCLVGWPAVFLIPNKYETLARVYVDVDSMLTPLLRGLAVESNPLQQLDFMQRTLLSRPNLEQVVHLADLDSQAKTPADKDALLTSLAQTVRISLQGTNLFSISYDDTDAVESKNVVKAVLTVFSETSAGNSRSEMDNARRFLEEQIANYEKQLRAAEQRRAEFKETYGDVLPQTQANESRLQQINDEVAKFKLQLADVQARRDAIAKDMATVPQTLSVDQAAQVVIHNGSSLSPKQVQLDEAKRRLSDLQSRYTDDFPDVVATKRDIASLEQQIKDDASNKGASDGDSRKSTVPNPLYQEVKMRLVDAESTVASVQRQLDYSVTEQKRIQEAVKAAPGIQLQAQNLDRDYDILKKNYDELIQRREAANLAQAADTQADKVQFRIVDAPQVPLTPISPNRPILYTGVLIAGLGAGIGAAFLLVQLDRSFSTLAGLRAFGLPVLGSISRVTFLDTRKRTVQQVAGLAASTVMLLIIYGALLLANYTAIHKVI